MRPETSIVIRARDEGHCLGECIDLIEAQTVSDCEIICVYDPRSEDGTLAVARSRGLRIVTLNEDAFSYGRSINSGVDAALGEFVVLLSAHAFPVDEHWLAELLAPLRNTPALAASFSRQIPAKGAYAFWARDLLFAFPEEGGHAQVAFSNSSSCFRKATWTKYPFDESIDYAEDLAWYRTIKAANLDVAYCATSVVRHSHNETFAQIATRARRERIALHQIGAWHATPSARIQTIVQSARAMVRDSVECAMGREPLRELAAVWRYRIATASGFIHGTSQISNEKR